MKVLVFSSLNLDFVYQVDHFVNAGETLSAVSVETNAGGKGLNASIALKRAGADVCFAGAIGEEGVFLKNLLNKEGIDTSGITPVAEKQGNAIIQVNKEGENCILLFSGSNSRITQEHINRVISSFDEGDYLLIQNEINNLDKIIYAAYERGMKIVFNPSPFKTDLLSLPWEMFDWVILNSVEAEALTGETESEKVRERIHDKWRGLKVVLTQGKNGSYAFTEDETVFQEAFKVDAVDTTAAGDTFTGFFLANLIQGKSLTECMKRAALASGIAVTRRGASPSIPTFDEVDALYKKLLEEKR